MVRTIDPQRRPQEQAAKRSDDDKAGTMKKQTVLIIGLGLSGCTVAHFLGQAEDHYDVTCFEQLPVPGLYAHSVQNLGGGTAILDMPLRAVSPHYYNNLFQLYNHLDIELEQTNYAHTVINLDSRQPIFSYVNVCVFGRAIPLPSFHLAASVVSAAMILLGFLQFVLLTPWTLFWKRKEISGLTLDEYLNQYGFNAEFQQGFLIPILSTLLSCSYRQTQKYPAVLIAEFCVARMSTLFTGWFRVKGVGVFGVAKKLLRGMEGKCHFNIQVVSVAKKNRAGVENCVEVGYQQIDSGGSSSNNNNNGFAGRATTTTTTTFRTFDHVIVAVEPDVAKRLVVTDPATAEGRGTAAYLNSTSSFTADIIAHRDRHFMTSSYPSAGASSPAAPAAASSASAKNGHGSSTTFSTNSSYGDDKNKKQQQQQTADGSSSPSSSSSLAQSPPSSPAFSVAAPSTGLTVFTTPVDAAALDLFCDAPRNASSTTANIAMLYNSGDNSNNSNGSATTSSSTDGTGAGSESSSLPTGHAQLYETWNPVGVPRHIVKRARMTRAVWTVEGMQTAEKFAAHSQGHNNIWFCGSWSARGVTLLEQACSSALDVVQDFGVELPWRPTPSDQPLNSSWWLLLISLVLHIWKWCIGMCWMLWIVPSVWMVTKAIAMYRLVSEALRHQLRKIMAKNKGKVD